jgi:filamentous hemagglutinin family protein
VASAVLNRVVGADISQINGSLLSNGRVFLIAVQRRGSAGSQRA